MYRRTWVALPLGVILSACAMQRAEVANDAQNKMLGLAKEQVLACMGPPVNKATVGATEVWSYDSGNGFTASSYGNGFASSSTRHCTVNVTMTNGTVSALNYMGPTGGLLSPNEQCAYAVANCVAKP
jgi:hypothetical protein